MRFRRGQRADIPPADVDEADRMFAHARTQNPRLFDGPMVLCCGLRSDSAGAVDIDWTPATYRALALRQLGYRVSALFVTVLLPTHDGGVVIARAAEHTAKAGLWQLPGGSVMPPAGDRELDVQHLAEEASRELLEETGIRRDAAMLRLWAVSQGENGNAGICFLALPADATDILNADRYIRSTADSELDELATLHASSALDDVCDRAVDYLAPCLRLYLHVAESF